MSTFWEKSSETNFVAILKAKNEFFNDLSCKFLQISVSKLSWERLFVNENKFNQITADSPCRLSFKPNFKKLNLINCYKFFAGSSPRKQNEVWWVLTRLKESSRRQIR